MPQTRRGVIRRRHIVGRIVADFRPVLMEFVVNGPFELGRSRVNRLGQCKSIVADDHGPQAAHMRLHPAAQVAPAQGMLSVPAEMNFHQGDPIDVPVQRALDHAFDPERQFVITINVLVGDDDGFLYALDSDSGRILWRYRVGLRFGSAPARKRPPFFPKPGPRWIRGLLRAAFSRLIQLH